MEGVKIMVGLESVKFNACSKEHQITFVHDINKKCIVWRWYCKSKASNWILVDTKTDKELLRMDFWTPDHWIINNLGLFLKTNTPVLFIHTI